MGRILPKTYADKFIISGAATPAYLMSDVSTVAVSGQILKVIFICIIIHPLQMQARLDIMMLIIRLLHRFGYRI